MESAACERVSHWRFAMVVLLAVPHSVVHATGGALYESADGRGSSNHETETTVF